MPTIANPFNPGRAVDLSAEINLIPNEWGLFQQLGLFTNEPKAHKFVMIPRTTEIEAVAVDRNWDERNSTVKSGDRDFLTLAIPHFPVDDAVTPNDVDGVIDYDSLLAGGNTLETIPQVMARKMEHLRKVHALTLEVARAQLIRDGSVYAPNGTVVTNFYTEFGVGRESVNFDLSSTTIDPLGAANNAIAAVQDGILAGDTVTDIIALCSPSFFNALVKNPFVVESYRYFNQAQGTAILNQRLGTGRGLDSRYRVFEYGGITFIEVRGSVGGQPYVADGEAYLLPMGSDIFRTFFAPANRFSTINRTASELYMFQHMGGKDDIIELMTESNFLNVMTRPQAVITLTASD